MSEERDYTRYRIGKPLDLEGRRILNVGEPEADDDAVPKRHVDARMAELERRLAQLERHVGKQP